jgi:hypothetical protein
MRAFAELRRRQTATVVLALLVGLSGAIVMTAWAGARRTDSAYPRYLTATHAADFLISNEESGSPATEAFYHQVERLPQVARSGIGVGPSLVSETSGRPDADLETFIQTFASKDGKAGYTVDGLRITAGRMPRADKPYEAVVNTTLAQRRHVGVGSRLTMYWTPPTVAQLGSDAPPSRLRPVSFTITGVGVSPDEVVPVAPNDGAPSLFVTPAYDRIADVVPDINYDGVFVRLRPGTDHATFVSEVDRLARASGGHRGLDIFVADLSVHAARVERAIHPEALALELFAGLVALGALLAIGQVIAREVAVGSAEDTTLRALGFDRRQLVTVAVARVAGAVVLGTALAVVLAVAASPLTPIGAARRAEPSPGLSVDPFVLGLGSLGLIAGLLAAAGWSASRHASSPAWRHADARALRRPSRTVESLARLGLRPAALTGLRMTFEPGGGATALPLRSTMAGLVVAVSAVVAVMTFSVNLGGLVSNPPLFGDTWSFALDSGFNASAAKDVVPVLERPGVAAVAGGNYGDDVTLDGRTVPMIGVDPLVGSVFPTLVSGRRPMNAHEIVLGAKTMRELHKGIGDRVTLRSRGRARALTVVGQVVLPSLGRGSFTPTDLGEGAATVASVVAQVPAGPGSYNFFLFRYAPSADASALSAQLSAFAHKTGCPGDACLLDTHRVLPPDVQSYDRVRATPAVLAATLALLGLAVLGHALVTSIRRRRREVAVLKTMGFVNRDVAVAVAWHASAFAVVSVVVGVPLGLALGHWLWSSFANQLGIPGTTTFPVWAAAVVPVVIVAANLLAALPARAAARISPARVLRSE